MSRGVVQLCRTASVRTIFDRLHLSRVLADPDLPRRMDGTGEGMTIGTTFFQNLNARTKAFAKAFGERTAAAGISRAAQPSSSLKCARRRHQINAR